MCLLVEVCHRRILAHGCWQSSPSTANVWHDRQKSPGCTIRTVVVSPIVLLSPCSCEAASSHVRQADSIWDVLFFKPKVRKVHMCMPAFMQIDMMSQLGPVWIMGMPFFRYYHTTFDRTPHHGVRRLLLLANGGACAATDRFFGMEASSSMGSRRAWSVVSVGLRATVCGLA